MIDAPTVGIRAIEGGITAPAGFRAAGVAAGIKRSGDPDIALIVPDRPASGAALFTTNQVQAAPVVVSRRHLEQSKGRVAGVLVNSGCANACTGAAGLAVADQSATVLAARLGCPVEQVVIASTGVIGVALDGARVAAGIESAFGRLDPRGGGHAARAILTTDLGPKEHAVRVETPDGSFVVGGMAKGAGMIEPMMATMLAFLTTDAHVEPSVLQEALIAATDDTLNAITVDGECSTNDTVVALASGASRVRVADQRSGAGLVQGLRAVCRELALAIVRGGEGATKLVAIRVTGAADVRSARRAARTIANSPLVKTAIHGGDPNWGRLVAAAGRSGVPFDLSRCLVKVGPVVLFRDGQPYDEAAPDAATLLAGAEIEIQVDMGTGGAHDATVWTCDLSAEYVRINGEYRT
jgi:glutamate N-acetyltransferase/amino-acid N-acetyltransferase